MAAIIANHIKGIWRWPQAKLVWRMAKIGPLFMTLSAGKEKGGWQRLPSIVPDTVPERRAGYIRQNGRRLELNGAGVFWIGRFLYEPHDLSASRRDCLETAWNRHQNSDR